MTSTENLERQQPTCQCGCCGPTATAVMEPPATKDKATDDKADDTCQCGCASASTEGCDCGCTDTGCDCGCGGSAD